VTTGGIVSASFSSYFLLIVTVDPNSHDHHFFWLATGECLNWSHLSQSSKSLSSQVSSVVRCMQYGLKNQWSRHLFKHRVNADWLSLSPCTPTIGRWVHLYCKVDFYPDKMPHLAFAGVYNKGGRHHKWSHSFVVTDSNALWDIDVVKSDELGHCSM